MVTSVFASGGDWDGELEGMREGWRTYLHNLRLYLTGFPGQRCSWIMALGNVPGAQDRAWAALAGALGLHGAAEGERRAMTASGVPALEGAVEQVVGGRHHRGLTLRVEAPASGFALVYVSNWQDRVYTNLHAYLFGDQAPEVAARVEPAWRAWMEEHCVSAEAASKSDATAR